MGVQQWSLRPGDLGRLDAPGRSRFARRLADRVHPWSPAAAADAWAAATATLADDAPADPDLARLLTSAGGAAWAALTEASGDLTGRCANQALTTLAALVDGDLLAACKAAASLPALRAHAGRTAEPVDTVTPAFWALLRADLASDTGDAAPLWPDGEPDWSRPTAVERAALDSDEVTRRVTRELRRPARGRESES